MFDVNKIREDFPILKRKVNGYDLVFLDSAASSQKPKQVIKAVVDFWENHNANVHRGVHTLSVEATTMMDEARKKIAKFINAKPEETIFVRNATEGINLVAYAWGRKNLKQGDVVIASLLEHHSDLVPWQEMCRETGATLKIIDVDGEGRLKIRGQRSEVRDQDGVVCGPLSEILDERCKLIAVTAVSNVLGTIVKIADLRLQIAHLAPKALLLVDGCQQVPHMPADVKKMGVDFLVFSGHKMLGPSGVGVLYGRKEILEKMDPFMFGGDMISEVKAGHSTWAELPHKFEAGTPDFAGVVMLGAAVDYLTDLGMENVREHEKKLIEYGLEKMKGLEEDGLVTIYGPKSAEERGGVLTFNVNGVHAHDAAQVLDRYGIAVRSGQHCGAPIVEFCGTSAMCRASFYIYNTESEIDYLVEKLREVKKVFSI